MMKNSAQILLMFLCNYFIKNSTQINIKKLTEDPYSFLGLFDLINVLSSFFY